MRSGIPRNDRGMTDQPPEPQSFVIPYQTENGRTRIQCRFEGESIWLTHALVAGLFATTPQNIIQHLRAIYEEGELDESATCKPYYKFTRKVLAAFSARFCTTASPPSSSSAPGWARYRRRSTCVSASSSRKSTNSSRVS